jgi:hypothetical protein
VTPTVPVCHEERVVVNAVTEDQQAVEAVRTVQIEADRPTPTYIHPHHQEIP